MLIGREPQKLQCTLDFAYDIESIGAWIQKRFLHRYQQLAALTPINTHVMKDRRLIVAYRAQIQSGLPGENSAIPMVLHCCHYASGNPYARYRSDDVVETGRLVPQLKRDADRIDENCFLTHYPADPELKGVARLMKPSALLDCYNDKLSQADDLRATHIHAALLNYRPERRVVLLLSAISPEGIRRRFLLKIYRRGQARRLWEIYRLLRDHCGSLPEGVCWPLSVDLETGAMLYPYIEGVNLHELFAGRLASDRMFKRTAEQLEAIHNVVSYLKGVDEFPVFTHEDELALLRRWQAFLKKGQHPWHGSMSKVLESLDLNRGSFSVPGLLHRDFYCKQILISPYSEKPMLVDIDTLAQGPRALDLSNFKVHLDALAVQGLKKEQIRRAKRAFMRAYHSDDIDHQEICWYEVSALARLACLGLVASGRGDSIGYLENRIRSTRRSLQGI